VFQKVSTDTHSCRFGIAATAVLCIAPVSSTLAGNESNAPTVMTAGLNVKELARVPGVVFAHELADVPGKNLVVVKLDIPPKSAQRPASSDQAIGHRHPGSVYVYVIKGTVRFGIEGQPAQVVHAGESTFEPVGAVHTVLESTSSKKPATVIAVMIVPDGAPILTPVEGHKK
jgi:quercetin dioxygenase-like cupin family protein